eukprot:g1795.t1
MSAGEPEEALLVVPAPTRNNTTLEVELLRDVGTVQPDQEALDGRLSIASYNICALAFPFKANPLVLFLGMIFGLDLTDRSCDAALDALGPAGKARIKRHASYIRSTGADLVMLQEVSGVADIDEIVRCLGGDYQASYATTSPPAIAVIGWILMTLMISAAGFGVLEGVLIGILGAGKLALWWGRLLRFLAVLLLNLVRWRHSTITHYLLGTVGGQLAILRRSACSSCGPLTVEGFTLYDPDIVQMGVDALARNPHADGDGGGAAPGWLQAFFAVRPRGVLTVRAPLYVSAPTLDPAAAPPTVAAAAGAATAAAGELVLMNTHMPHGSDNRLATHGLAELIDNAPPEACVVFGGDLNPRPNVAIDEQLRPLLARQIRPTNPLIENSNKTGPEFVTWDLNQPMTRNTEDCPFDMQLDFLLPRPLKPGARLELQHVRTEVLGCDAFFEPGKPISDHFALKASWALAKASS